MKFFLIVDKDKEPSVTVVCNSVTDTVAKIEQLCKESAPVETINGYLNEEIVPLCVKNVRYFCTEGGKVFASIDNQRFLTKLRIKDIEDFNDTDFVKINQGCVVNVKKIKKFRASIGGSLMVEFEDGYCDYVARRELKNVKRRLGL